MKSKKGNDDRKIEKKKTIERNKQREAKEVSREQDAVSYSTPSYELDETRDDDSK